MLVEVVDDDLWNSIPFELDDNTGVLVRLVADSTDVGDDLLVHETGNTLDKCGPVDVVGNLGDDDLLATSLDLLDSCATADLHGAAPCLKVLPDTSDSAKLASRREVGPLDVLHQLVERDVGIVDLGANGVDGLAEVMRRDIGRHADSDAGAAIDEKVRDRGWENGRLLAGVVVVRDEIDRIVIHVLHEDGAERTQACLGITHGGRRITLDGTEVALPFNEGFAHRPGLGHVNKSRIDSLVTMGVIVTHGLADDLGALEMLAGRHDPELAHGKQDAALGGLQTIASIGKRPGNDDRHGVVEEGSGDLFGDIDRFDFFVLVIQGIGPKGRFGIKFAQYSGATGIPAREKDET